MRLHYQERPALGSTVQMGLVSNEPDVAEQLLRDLWLELLLFENRCSRFLPDSELSQFNRGAGVRRLVSAEFRDVLLAAKRMAALTGGMFNPFVLPSLQRSGYDRSLVPGHADDVVDDHSSKRLIESSKLEVGDNWASIPYGSAIDLGGCGKGYIGDVLAALVDAVPAIHGYWLSIGGDIIVSGSNDKSEPWTIYLQPDPKQSNRLGEVAVPLGRKLAVATSTTLLRRGTNKGKKWHHIINPATGEPANTDIDIMIICSESLLKADVLASCGVICGSSNMGKFLQRYNPESAAWLKSGMSRLQAQGDLLTAYDTWTAFA